MSLVQNQSKSNQLLPQVLFLLTPALFTGYSATVAGDLRTYTIGVSLPQFGLALLALGEVGAVVAIAWRRRMQFTLVASLAGIVAFPFLLRAVPGQAKAATGYVLALLVPLLCIAAFESGVNNRKRITQSITSRPGRISLGAGLAHAILAVVLQLDTRTLVSLFPFRVVAVPLLSVLVIVVTAGAVAAWMNGTLRSPAVVIGVWMSIGVYQTLTVTTRRDAFSAIDWSGLTPSPDYLFSMPVLFVILSFVVGLEHTVRQGIG